MTCELTIEPIGMCVDVDEEQTLLDASLRNGQYLPHACCHGLCGTCKVQVLEGEVDDADASSFALMDFEREEGITLACCARPLSDVVIEADIEEDPDALVQPVEDYEGKVVDLVALSPTVKGVFIELDRDIEFQAGKYINLSLPDIGLPRAFSLANSPVERRTIELNVRLVPGGEATEYIHNRLQVGDRLQLSGPYGRFFVRKSAPENVLFFAGGTGLSSVRSMIVDMLESGDGQEITLFYGQRHRAELYYHDVFRALAAEHEHFTYVPALSEPRSEDDWHGATGMITEVANDYMDGQFSGSKAYLCGPPAMIDACLTTLMRGRLFERDIYTEKFIDASTAAQDARKSPLFKSI